MLRSPLSSPLRSPLSSPLAARRGGGAYNPVAVYGADLVTWYGNSVDDLWRDQAAGGPVTLYQDNAGATPITSLEQTVGRINDLSGNGHHLSQSTPTSRGRLSARYNLMTATEDLAGAAWLPYGVTRTAAPEEAPPIAGMTVTRVTETAISGNHYVGQSGGTLIPIIAGATYRLSAYIKQGSGTRNARFSSGNTTFIQVAAVFDLVNGTVVQGDGATIEAAGNGWWRCSVVRTAEGTGTTQVNPVHLSAGTTMSYVGDPENSLLVTAVDFRLAAYPASWPQYQRVTTASDYDTVGFPARLLMDGVDDGYSSGSIDLTSTDAAAIFSCAAKLSDAAVGRLYEFSPTTESNNGSFSLAAPGGAAAANYIAQSRGSALSSVTAGSLASPHVALLAHKLDISDDLLSLSVNDAAAVTSATDQGSGNLGNYPLFVGRRNLASEAFNGVIFSLPMIVKRAVTTGEESAAKKAFGKTIGVLQ